MLPPFNSKEIELFQFIVIKLLTIKFNVEVFNCAPSLRLIILQFSFLVNQLNLKFHININ